MIIFKRRMRGKEAGQRGTSNTEGADLDKEGQAKTERPTPFLEETLRRRYTQPIIPKMVITFRVNKAE